MHIRVAQRKIRPELPDLQIDTDASMSGWGAFSGGKSAGGRWLLSEIDHINVLELEAVYLGLLTFCRKPGINVHVRSDNTTAVAYVRKMGGVRSERCNKVAQKIWNWAETNESWITVSHVPGILNTKADAASRQFKDNLEWSLNPGIFQKICDRFGTPNIDLFASRENAKCVCYMSRNFDPYSVAIDAFTQSWQDLQAYVFPPFSLIGRVLRKMEEDRPRSMIIVAPDWATAPWYTKLITGASRIMKIGKKKKNIMPNDDYQDNYPRGVGLIVSVFLKTD